MEQMYMPNIFEICALQSYTAQNGSQGERGSRMRRRHATKKKKKTWNKFYSAKSSKVIFQLENNSEKKVMRKKMNEAIEAIDGNMYTVFFGTILRQQQHRQINRQDMAIENIKSKKINFARHFEYFDLLELTRVRASHHRWELIRCYSICIREYYPSRIHTRAYTTDVTRTKERWCKWFVLNCVAVDFCFHRKMCVCVFIRCAASFIEFILL